MTHRQTTLMLLRSAMAAESSRVRPLGVRRESCGLLLKLEGSAGGSGRCWADEVESSCGRGGRRQARAAQERGRRADGTSDEADRSSSICCDAQVAD